VRESRSEGKGENSMLDEKKNTFKRIDFAADSVVAAVDSAAAAVGLSAADSVVDSVAVRTPVAAAQTPVPHSRKG
jgi:hypothetical protein